MAIQKKRDHFGQNNGNIKFWPPYKASFSSGYPYNLIWTYSTCTSTYGVVILNVLNLHYLCNCVAFCVKKDIVSVSINTRTCHRIMHNNVTQNVFVPTSFAIAPSSVCSTQQLSVPQRKAKTSLCSYIFICTVQPPFPSSNCLSVWPTL